MKSSMRHLSPLRWCVIAIAVVAALALPSLSGGAAPKNSDGLDAYFDRAEGTTPLDIFGVRFGQTASTDLTLIIRTHEPWETSAINPRFGRSLCVILRSDEQAHPAGRLCAYPSETAKSGLALRYTVLDPATGVQRGIRDLSPVVSRPSKTTIRVTFPPPLLRLKPGLYHWVARSQYRDDATCPPPAGCEDTLPDSGEANMQITLSVSPEARQRCFGAASRDARKPCRNPGAHARRRPDARRRGAHAEHPLHPAQADRARHPVRVRRAGRRRAQHGRAHRRQPRRALARGARDRVADGEVARRVGHALGLPVHAGDRAPRAGEPAQRVRALEPARSRAGWRPTRGSARCSSSRTTTRASSSRTPPTSSRPR